MNVKEANEIAETYFDPSKGRIPAIKMMRENTYWGLRHCVEFMNENATTKENLIVALTKEFVVSKHERLLFLRQQRVELDMQIANLEQFIEEDTLDKYSDHIARVETQA